MGTCAGDIGTHAGSSPLAAGRPATNDKEQRPPSSELWMLLAITAAASELVAASPVRSPTMKRPSPRARHEVVDHEVVDHDAPLVHEWRVTQLTRLGIPWLLAQAVADHVDWHQVARLVQCGCPPRLALRIVR